MVDDSKTNYESPIPIPVIDLSKPDEDVAKELVAAFQTIGFATLIHHGIPLNQMEDAFQASSKFFALSPEEKLKYKYQGHKSNRGYIPFMSETHEHVSADIKETFDLGTQGEAQYTTPWPDELKETPFQRDLLTYYHSCETVFLRMMKLIGVGLNIQDSGYFADRSQKKHCNLRLLHYPAVKKSPDITVDDDETIIRGARHTDFGTLTLLAQDGTGGLRVQHLDGSWSFVPPVPGSLIVNVGDMLMRWTNDTLRATPHQVVNLPSHGDMIPERYSIAFFCNADPDCLLEVVEGVSSDPPKYEPVTAHQYLTKRLTDTIAPK